MSRREQEIDHLYRRAGFGASEQEVDDYTRLSLGSYAGAVARLLGYTELPDDVDAKIGTPGFVGVTARGGAGFQPATNILDARQRWLFRMLHSKRPLQEKMALFWHNHFATAYTKVVGEVGDSLIATRMFAAKPEDDSSATQRAARAVPRPRARQLPRSARRRRQRSGDALLARRPYQRPRPSAGEFRPRAHGAVHDGRRRIRGDRRLRRGARVHRLEPCLRQPQHRPRALRLPLRSPGSTKRRPRSSRSRFIATAAGSSRRGPPPTACRTASI